MSKCRVTSHYLTLTYAHKGKTIKLFYVYYHRKTMTLHNNFKMFELQEKPTQSS